MLQGYLRNTHREIILQIILITGYSNTLYKRDLPKQKPPKGSSEIYPDTIESLADRPDALAGMKIQSESFIISASIEDSCRRILTICRFAPVHTENTIGIVEDQIPDAKRSVQSGNGY